MKFRELLNLILGFVFSASHGDNIFMKFRELLNLIVGFVFSASHGDNIFYLIKENQEDFKLHMM